MAADRFLRNFRNVFIWTWVLVGPEGKRKRTEIYSLSQKSWDFGVICVHLVVE
jgi:hypothetical protein